MEKETQVIDRRVSNTVADHELLGDKANISHDEAMHFGVLTEEELAIEKKLRRKIDTLIMYFTPLCWNYFLLAHIF